MVDPDCHLSVLRSVAWEPLLALLFSSIVGEEIQKRKDEGQLKTCRISLLGVAEK